MDQSLTMTTTATRTANDPPARLLPEEGQLVRVRSRIWTVGEVKGDDLGGVRGEVREAGHHLVTLSSMEEDALGEETQVLWELEPGVEIFDRMGLPAADGLDDPATLHALLNASIWSVASNADVRHVQSPFRSGIEIEDYQLKPLLRAIQMSRANLLIADDVGLGKTIETGLILLEFIVRHRAKRILIACPPGLQQKWQDEMKEKFGLDFHIVDSAAMRQIRRERGIHVNPWDSHPFLITSIHYIKRDRPRRLFMETVPGEHEPFVPRRWDILVLDEAQNCAPASSGRYALDSDCTETIRQIGRHFQHRLFLSATPHNGYEASWTALLEMLDDQRFARGAQPDPKQLEHAMIRRLKTEIPDHEDGTPRFPRRKIHALEVAYPAEEIEIHELLKRFGELRRKNQDGKSGSFAAGFVHKLLKKRLFSSPIAFGKTLDEHVATLKGRKRKKVEVKYDLLRKRLSRVDEEEFADEIERDEATLDALQTAADVQVQITDDEQDLIDRMRTWAEAASRGPDAKAQALIDWLKEHIRPGGVWSDRRVIIFTEYRDTQKWLIERLAQEDLVGGGRLEALYGGMDPKARKSIIDRFQKPPSRTDVRILLATECAGEGIDLQNHCDLMVHYEIPWNPNRLEQRNGRIDRRGQPSEFVHIHHFVAKGYRDAAGSGAERSELAADLEFLMRAAEKIETSRRALGSVGPVIARQVEEAMLGDRLTLDVAKEEQEAAAADRRLPHEKDIADQIRKMAERLEETRDELQLDPRTIEAAVSIGLALAEKDPLRPFEGDDDIEAGEHRLFWMPNFSGSWAVCREGLRDPVFEKIRPITFDHAAAEAIPDVVLVHLNHPLVQKCLRRLRAEIWRDEDRKGMHRITAQVVPSDALEDLGFVVHARMMVVGGGRYRLHEEVLMAGGTRSGGTWRQFPQGEMKTLLESTTGEAVPESSNDLLLAAYDEARSLLETAVRARVKDRQASIERQLGERRDKEIAELELRMTELEASIREQLDAKPEQDLLFKELEPEAKVQLERNRAALEQRLRELPQELEDEKGEFVQRFEDQLARDFPIAVTILVPEGWTP
jgi:ERCC4-related helicase